MKNQVKLYFPAVSIPFQSRIHPRQQAANQAGYEWAASMRLLKSGEARERFKMAIFGNLAGRCYPQANYDELILANQYAIWLFMHDDHCDETDIGAQPARLLAYHRQIVKDIKHNTILPDSPLTQSLYDILCFVRKLGGDDLAKRFWRNHLLYFEGCQWEAVNRQQYYQPAVAEYIAGRDKASAVFPCLDLGEIAYNTLDLPAEIRQSDVFHRATLLCNRVVSHVNDIYSFYKEYERDDMHNLVIAVKAQHGLTIPEAMDATAAIIHENIAAFRRAEAELLSLANTPDTQQMLQRYCRLLRDWMRGNLDWSQETARYQQQHIVPQGESLSYLENIL